MLKIKKIARNYKIINNFQLNYRYRNIGCKLPRKILCFFSTQVFYDHRNWFFSFKILRTIFLWSNFFAARPGKYTVEIFMRNWNKFVKFYFDSLLGATRIVCSMTVNIERLLFFLLIVRSHVVFHCSYNRLKGFKEWL